ASSDRTNRRLSLGVAGQFESTTDSREVGRQDPEGKEGLVRQEEAVDVLINSEAWREGATLEIGSNCYQVERNPPSIISLSLPSVIMFGFPVFPVAHFEFVDRAHTLYEWFVDADEVKAVEHEERTWQLVGNAEFFTPSVQHVGRKLRFRVTPGDGTRLGESQEKETTAVEASPGRCTFDSRHRFTTDKTALGTLRVISYNILADTYAQTELARTVLFPYCPPYAMDLGYRQQLLQKELKGYNGDIICLQEVDNRVFERLTPVLQRLGFEGAAVRLVQAVLALHHLEHVTSTMHPSTPVVFCGDFNSTPDTGLYDFITSGTFSACHDDWRRLEGENDVPAGFGIEVGHNLGMYSACGEPEYTNFVQSFNGCLDYVFASRDALQIVQILPMPSHEEITAHIALPSITHPSDHIALVSRKQYLCTLRLNFQICLPSLNSKTWEHLDKSISKLCSPSIPSHSSTGPTADSACEKAECLNFVFASKSHHQTLSLYPTDHSLTVFCSKEGEVSGNPRPMFEYHPPLWAGTLTSHCSA
uniref:Phosphodiesterase 12 n=1 Tax=Eptatretus burgeri TaxID=7764 RepID=A0A8C4PZJ2_EPTBU